MMRTTLTAALLALAGAAAAGDVAYRWVDADGVTHFSDRPPPRNVRAETLELPEYRLPATPAYSYVALLERLRALEAEVDEARRSGGSTHTVFVPYPVRVSEPQVVYSAIPGAFPRRPVFRPPIRPVPGMEDPRNGMSSFDRLFESRRGPGNPPGN